MRKSKALPNTTGVPPAPTSCCVQLPVWHQEAARSLSKLFVIFPSSLPPFGLVVGYCSLTTNTSQVTFPSFLSKLSAQSLDEILRNLSPQSELHRKRRHLHEDF